MKTKSLISFTAVLAGSASATFGDAADLAKKLVDHVWSVEGDGSHGDGNAISKDAPPKRTRTCFAVSF